VNLAGTTASPACMKELFSESLEWTDDPAASWIDDGGRGEAYTRVTMPLSCSGARIFAAPNYGVTIFFAVPYPHPIIAEGDWVTIPGHN